MKNYQFMYIAVELELHAKYCKNPDKKSCPICQDYFKTKELFDKYDSEEAMQKLQNIVNPDYPIKNLRIKRIYLQIEPKIGENKIVE